MEHVFEAASCTFCHADDHDIGLPEKCPVEREPISYTTETPCIVEGRVEPVPKNFPE